MKTQEWKMEDGGWQTRSVLECGSPLPLSLGGPRLSADQSARGLAQSKTCRAFVAMLLFFASTVVVHAQFAIDWYSVDGGGGTSMGGVYAVTGTIGQPDAGKMSGGSFALEGGFWSLLSVVQTPGAPTLTITPAAPGQATISWTPATPGFVLQESASLASPNWTNSPSGPTNPITVPASGGTKFYRLKN